MWCGRAAAAAVQRTFTATSCVRFIYVLLCCAIVSERNVSFAQIRSSGNDKCVAFSTDKCLLCGMISIWKSACSTFCITMHLTGQNGADDVRIGK